MQSRFEELKKDLLPRFWDTRQQTMVYPELHHQAIVYHVISNHLDYFNPIDFMLLRPKKFIPMKPTGLKDKNGKLIYENDYIRNLQTGFIFLVIWHNNGWCVRCDGICKPSPIADNEFICEKIGNIHANPELIEVQK